MIEILPAPDHLGAYRITGTLTEGDVERVIADIEDKLSRHEKLGLLADVTGLEHVTLRAGLKDLRYSVGKLRELKRFSREAVVAGEGWLATLTPWLAPAIPYVEIRTFRPEEFDAALAWAGDIEGGPNA